MLFNSAIPKIAPSISDTIFKDSATTGVLVNFDTAWNVKWHGVGFLPIGLNFQPTNNQFYNLNRILVTGNNFPLNSYNKLASARYKINTDTSPIYFDKQTNGYKFTSITDFSNKGKLINNYWLKHSVVSTQKIQNIFYYKRGFGFLLSKTDSFEFGKNKTSWGKVKPRNCNGPMNCVSLIIVDTISNKINYDFTPENVGNFAYINDYGSMSHTQFHFDERLVQQCSGVLKLATELQKPLSFIFFLVIMITKKVYIGLLQFKKKL